MITIPYEIAKKIVLDHVHPVTAWRQYYGMSEEMLAQRMELPKAAIAKIESSNQHLLPANLNKLAHIFGVVPDALISRYQSLHSYEGFYHA